jgi:hypothetical protein
VWDFKPYGQCGKLLSEVVAPLGAVVDDLAFIHNMVGKSGVHSTGTLLQATGFQLPGFPGAGCWVSYALGSLNDNLPTFVVLPDHRGFASNGVKNWDSAVSSVAAQWNDHLSRQRNAHYRSLSSQVRPLCHRAR